MFVELRKLSSGDMPPLEQPTRGINPETSHLNVAFSNPLNSSVNLHCISQKTMKISSF